MPPRPVVGGGRLLGADGQRADWLRLLALLALVLLGSARHPAQGQANVARAEYFLDTDPGLGSATAFGLPATPAADLAGLTAAVPLGSLNTGFHQLGVRSQDATGAWSLTSRRSFYYEPALGGALTNVNKVEYFIDTDPGFGSATDVAVTAGADVGGVAVSVNLSSLSAGFHQLGLRSRDASGQWSLTSRRAFYYEPALSGALANVTKIEYFIDTDPGFGAATDIPATAGTDVSGVAVAVNLGSLSAGFHQLAVRTRDAGGAWSLTSRRSFYYEPNVPAAANITRIETYFDTDPGFGAGTSVPIPNPAPDLPSFGFAVDASALADGAHTVFLRTRDANGQWSLVSSQGFVKNGCGSSLNFAGGLAAGSYTAGGAVAGPVAAGFNSSSSAPQSTANTPYVLNGSSFLQVDLGAAQTINEVRLTLTASNSGTFVKNVQVQVQAAASTAGPFTTVATYSNSFAVGASLPAFIPLGTPATGTRVVRLAFTVSADFFFVRDISVYNFGCAGPVITSFTPTGGAGGTSVTLTGTNLSGATVATFNGVAASAASFTGNTATSLTLTAPVGGSTGPICITTPAGSTCSSGSYTYPPTIATGAVSPTAFCSSTFIQVPFTTNTGSYGAGNNFRFQLSDASGNFTAGSRLYGNLIITSASGGTLQDTVALRTPAGSGYRVRVVASNPATTGTDNGTNLTIYGTPAATATGNSPVAFNGTITLTAQPTGQSTYSWYVRYNSSPGSVAFVGGGQTLNIASAQPSQSGKYFVYVGNSNGCSDSASVRVLVQPSAVPALAMAQFGYSGCAPATFNIGFSVTGNSFASGNTVAAQLSDASGSFASATTIGSVTFAGQGSGAISATVPANTPTGSGYRIRLVGSNPSVVSTTDNGNNLSFTTQPTATAGSNSPVAYNGTITLTAATVAAATYTWVGPGFSSNQQNPTIPNATPGNSGTYTLFVTVGGCQSVGAGVAVTVQPSAVPILSMAQFGGTVCPGASLTIGFNATGNNFVGSNAITAQLSDASGSFASATAIGSVAFTGQGNGAVTATVPANTPGGTGYRVRLVGSNPAVVSQTDNGSNLTVPTAVATAGSNSPVAAGGTLTLSGGPGGANAYFWYFTPSGGGGNSLVSTQQNPSFTNVAATASGTYQLVVTSASGCQSTASTTVVVNPPTTTTLTTPVVSVAGAFCAGGGYGISFTVGGAGLSGGTVTVQLSDAGGSFAAPTNVGTVSFNGTGSGSIVANIPSAIAGGTGYRVRVVSTNPTLVSNDNGSDILIGNVANVVAGSNSPVAAGGTIVLNSSGISAGSTISWTGPNGFSSSQPNPTILNASAANAGPYQLSVSSNGCSTVRSLTVNVSAGTLALSTGSVTGSYCPGATLNVPFTLTAGTPNLGNVFTVQLSNAGGSFAAPVSIGALSSTASSGTITAQIPLATPAGSGYRVRVVASSPAAIGSDNGTNLTIGTLTYTWTGGNGNTSWFDPLNWSCGQVPGATSVVIIPGTGVTFWPVITGGTAALALNITIQSGAFFTNNGTFNLYGNVTVNSVNVSASSSSTWSFVSGVTQFLLGSQPFYCGNVVIGSGTTFTMNNALYVSNYWTNNGSYVGGSGYNVNFNGTGGTQIIGGSAVTSFYNVFVNTGAVVSLGINTVLLGNFSNGGTWLSGSYGVVFGGTVGQTIGGGGSSTFYSVVINNLVGLTLIGNITVLGDWLNNGVFVGGTYSVIFAGTLAQIIGGTAVTNFYNLTLQNAVSVTLYQNIYVLGGFANTGIFYGYYSVGGVTNGYFVRFGGTVAQVINVNTTTFFYHFYVDNAAGVSLATNIYIAGNYYLYSGNFAPGLFTVYFNGTGGLVQTVGGYTALSFYGWNIVSGAYVRLIQDVTWLGSFVNAGTFYGYNLVGGVYTYYASVFGGSVAQVISGGGLYEFGHVTIANLVVGGVTFNGPIYVFGNWLNNGVFYCGTGTIYFNGQLAQTIGGSVGSTFYHVSIGNLISVSLNQAIVVTGNWFGTGVFLGNGFLTYFNGSVAQTILTGLNTRFAAIRFNNAVSVTLLSNIYLNGNWTNDGGFIAGGFGVYFSGSSLQLIGGSALSLFHHLTISPSASVQINRVITLTGDWTNNGTFFANLFTVTFGGTVAQIIGGSTVSIFHGITFTNLVSVTLAQSIRVRGGWLNNGVFVPATFIVYFDGSAAQVIGGTAVSNTFFGLNILNTVGVSLSGPIFIGGNLVNDGLFTCAGYLVTFNGTVLQTIGGLSTTIFGSVTMNNAVGISLAQNIRVRGDFRNLALFTAGGFIVYFDGTVAQGIFCPSGTLTFHDVVFANLLGVSLQHNIFVTGNWTNNGGFFANGRLVTFSGTTLQLIGGTTNSLFHHFTISPNAVVRQLLGLTILGDWTNNGIFQHNNLLVYFNGTVLQTIAGTALTVFYDLTLANPVNVSLGFDIDVVRHFVNNGRFCGCGYRVRFNGTVPQTITCTSGNTHFHDITFANTAGVTLLDGIYVGGLWVNNGGYLANNQLVVFDGTALQTIAGSVLTAFYNIGITNAVNVQLLTNITVGGYWNNTGIFNGNGFLVTFNGTASQTITTTGAGFTRFHHVTWANPVGCVLGGDVYVRGNWLCNGPFNPATFTVYFDGTLAQTCGGSGQLNFYDLTCSNPAGISFANDVYLTHHFVNTGLVGCGLNTWYCTGSTAQTLGGSSATPTRFYDLIVQNPTSVSCTDNLFVTHLVQLTQGNLAANNHLTLVSNASGTAMVVNPVGGGEITGIATMERFIDGLGSVGYRHYSSPMKRSAGGVSTTVQEFADDLPVFELNPAYNTLGNVVRPFPTFFQYEESRLTAAKPDFDEGWLTPAATADLEPLRGYSAMTDPTTVVDISGVLQNGPVSFSLSRGTQPGSGFQLLGNPYPAPMDWDVARATPGMLTNVADALYVFQPSGRYTGAYKSYVNGLGQNGGSKDLAAMQGFFVRSTGPGAGSVSFTNAVRRTSYASPAFNRPAPAGPATTGSGPARPVLRLRVAPENQPALDDETVLYFEPGSALGFSPRHDAYKVQLNGSGRPSLWTLATAGTPAASAESFAINGLPDLATAPVVPLAVRVSATGRYVLDLSALALPAGTQVWLEDRALNRRQNLAATPRYTFDMNASYTGQRFYLNLVAGRPTAVTSGFLQARLALFPNPATATTTVELSGLGNQPAAQLTVLNTLGQPVLKTTAPVRQGAVSATLSLSGLPTGIYTVRIATQEGTATKRLVKE